MNEIIQPLMCSSVSALRTGLQLNHNCFISLNASAGQGPLSSAVSHTFWEAKQMRSVAQGARAVRLLSTSGGRRARAAAITVTDAAAERIRELLSRRSPTAAGVRIGLRTRGCNGMAYTLTYADEPSKFDEKVAIDGAELYIDPLALMHVVGTKMDFVDNELVSEFVFQNPNAKGVCGCGESFNV